MWKRLGIDTTTLTLWNENLRLVSNKKLCIYLYLHLFHKYKLILFLQWISKTILERLIKEFDLINEELVKHGFGDVSVGGVGLDRLRKTAQLAHVRHNIPSLSTLIQFLEISTNQEYLVKRIRELEKGGCMSDFKWNGGSTYNGKDWDYSLPTDSAVSFLK